jgi:hypothetical protein
MTASKRDAAGNTKLRGQTAPLPIDSLAFSSWPARAAQNMLTSRFDVFLAGTSNAKGDYID